MCAFISLNTDVYLPNIQELQIYPVSEILFTKYDNSEKDIVKVSFKQKEWDLCICTPNSIISYGTISVIEKFDKSNENNDVSWTIWDVRICQNVENKDVYKRIYSLLIFEIMQLKATSYKIRVPGGEMGNIFYDSENGPEKFAEDLSSFIQSHYSSFHDYILNKLK